MADEITLTLKIALENGEMKDERNHNRQSFDQSTQGVEAGIQTVGTTKEAIDLGDVGTPGLMYFKNLDSTNFVELGVDASGSFTVYSQLDPGEFCYIWGSSSATYQAKADTSAVSLEKRIYEA